MPSVLTCLNQTLHTMMREHSEVYLIGEDVLDPYGGAFKVTQGLSTSFPERVLSTPISEAGFLGIAIGMAMRGLRPIVEFMFGDFLALAADQIINHATKFHWMYNHQVHVPLVIRTPMGGYRGYGPTHSQTLEKHFIGVPGLRLLAVNTFSDPGALLYHAVVHDDHPVLFVEHKLLYPLEVLDPKWEADFSRQEMIPTSEEGYAATVVLNLRAAPPPTLTMVTYGYMAEFACLAAQRLAYEHEVFSTVIIPAQIAPLDIQPILASVEATHRLITIEEGTRTLGWGAEVIAQVQEASRGGLKRVARVGACDLPIPASRPLEARVLPSVEAIMQTALLMV